MQKKNEKIMRIGFVSDIDPFADRTSWSGTVFKLRESIERAGYEVVWVRFDKKLNDLRSKVSLRLLNWYMKWSGKNVIGTCYLDFFCRYFAKTIEREGIYKSCDCLFFAGPSGGQIAHYLKTKVPYIYLADACYQLMENYYWFNLSPYFARKARREENLAAQQAWLNIRSSQWAAEGTVRLCKARKETMYVLEFGANIDDENITVVKPYEKGTLNMVFSGTDWIRKGGETAVLATEALRRRGYDARLFMVGIKELPKEHQGKEYITNVGFLNKNTSADYQKYISLWKQAHLLLLPTRAECSAIVFSEAAAYGVPVFTYDTGGTGNYVENGRNGFMLPLTEGPEAFAESIANSIRNGQMALLAQGARELYDERLSWKRWSERFKDIIEKNRHALPHL